MDDGETREGLRNATGIVTEAVGKTLSALMREMPHEDPAKHREVLERRDLEAFDQGKAHLGDAVLVEAARHFALKVLDGRLFEPLRQAGAVALAEHLDPSSHGASRS